MLLISDVSDELVVSILKILASQQRVRGVHISSLIALQPANGGCTWLRNVSNSLPMYARKLESYLRNLKSLPAIKLRSFGIAAPSLVILPTET